MVEEYSTIGSQMESVRIKNKIIDHNLSTYIKQLHRKYSERAGRVNHLIKETRSVLDAIQSDQMKFRTKSYKIRIKVTDVDELKENSDDGKSEMEINGEDENEDDVFLEENKIASASLLSFSSLKLSLNPGFEKRQDMPYTSLSCINGHQNLSRQNSQRNSGLNAGNGVENNHNKQKKQILPSPKGFATLKNNLNANTHLHGNSSQQYVNQIHDNNGGSGSRSESAECIQWNSCMSRGHAPKRQIFVAPKYNGRLSSSGSLCSASTSEHSEITNEGGTSRKKKKNPRLRLPPVVPSIIHRLREMDKQRAFISTLKILD